MHGRRELRANTHAQTHGPSLNEQGGMEGNWRRLGRRVRRDMPAPGGGVATAECRRRPGRRYKGDRRSARKCSDRSAGCCVQLGAAQAIVMAVGIGRRVIRSGDAVHPMRHMGGMARMPAMGVRPGSGSPAQAAACPADARQEHQANCGQCCEPAHHLRSGPSIGTTLAPAKGASNRAMGPRVPIACGA